MHSNICSSRAGIGLCVFTGLLTCSIWVIIGGALTVGLANVLGCKGAVDFTVGMLVILLYPHSLMSWRVGTRGNYPYHSLGWLASLRGCEVLLVVVQASAGYCVLYGCPSRCTTCGCRFAKAARKCEGVGNGWEGLH